MAPASCRGLRRGGREEKKKMTRPAGFSVFSLTVGWLPAWTRMTNHVHAAMCAESSKSFTSAPAIA